MSKPRLPTPRHGLDPRPTDDEPHTLLAGRVFIEPIAYRITEAAAVIGLSTKTVWNLIAEGRLTARKVGGATVIRRQDLQDFVDCAPVAERKKVAQ